VELARAPQCHSATEAGRLRAASQSPTWACQPKSNLPAGPRAAGSLCDCQSNALSLQATVATHSVSGTRLTESRRAGRASA
jgi:hypothetical protein